MAGKSQFDIALKSNYLYTVPIIEREGFIKVNKDGRNVMMMKRQLGSNLERETLINITAQTIVPTALQQNSTSSYVDILITRLQQYKIDDIVWSFTVSVANQQVTLTPASFFT